MLWALARNTGARTQVTLESAGCASAGCNDSTDGIERAHVLQSTRGALTYVHVNSNFEDNTAGHISLIADALPIAKVIDIVISKLIEL